MLPPPVVALTPGILERDRAGSSERAIATLERAAFAAVRGGIRGIVVREPALEDGAVLELAMRLRAVLDGAGAEASMPGGSLATGKGWLCVHDRVHLVEAARADAGHVGGLSLPVVEARAVLGGARALGASSHASDSPARFRGADYLFHAPVFTPTSKEGHGGDVVGWSRAEAFAAGASLPVYGLGGVTAARLHEEARPDSQRALRGVALIGGLWGTNSDLDQSLRALGDLAGIERRAAALIEAALPLLAPVDPVDAAGEVGAP